MNIDICANHCPKLRGKTISLNNYHNHVYEYIPVIIDENTLFGDWICQMKPTMKEHPKLGEISVHEDCPFYVEHEFYDMNHEC